MTATQTSQQLDRCARALRTAECSLPASNFLRIAALMAARDEIDATLRTLRWRPRPRVSPAVLAVLVVCSLVFGYVTVKTVVVLTEGRPAVEVQSQQINSSPKDQ